MKKRSSLILVSFFVLMSAIAAGPQTVYGEERPANVEHISFSGGLWSYGFDLKVDISGSGSVTPSVSNIKPKNPGSWANLNITAHVDEIRKRRMPPAIFVSVAVKAAGKARSFSTPVVSFGDSSKYHWGEASDTDTVEEWSRTFLFSIEDYPELADIEDFQGGDAEINEEWEAPKPEEELQIKQRTYIDKVQGMVTIKKADGTVIKAENGTDLEIGDTVHTAANGKAVVYLANTALVKVKPGTDFKIPQDKANAGNKVGFIKMVKGFLFARAKKDRNSLKIATPNAICGVRGTDFEISYQDGETWVKVFDGTVWLAGSEGAEEIIINAGEKAGITSKELDVSGKWGTNFGVVTLEQSGDRVSGEYSHDGGKIEGTLNGSVLRGKWSEQPSYKPPKDAGIMEFKFSEDGASFKGKWRYGYEEGPWKGDWSGSRQ